MDFTADRIGIGGRSVHAHSGKRESSVWCLSVGLSHLTITVLLSKKATSSLLAMPCHGQRTFWPFRRGRYIVQSDGFRQYLNAPVVDVIGRNHVPPTRRSDRRPAPLLHAVQRLRHVTIRRLLIGRGGRQGRGERAGGGVVRVRGR